MKEIRVKKHDVYHGDLILVNRSHPLRNVGRSRLSAVSPEFPDIQMEGEACRKLQQLTQELRAGNAIVPVSGYRTRQEQILIYADSFKTNGKEFTERYVAFPDCSEHQTGLAIDLAGKQEEIDFIRPDFPYTGICGRFRKKASKFGFVERYTEEKQKVTGIGFEPWHFRYVGYPHAEIMCRKQMVLEEYIEWIKEYTFENRYAFTDENGVQFEIFYLPEKEAEKGVALPDHTEYRISGNNVDGYVITLWKQD